MRLACPRLLLAAAGLLAAPAIAGQALDLSLPDSPYRKDPPGTYYGDTSGVPLAEPLRGPDRRTRCPTGADGQPQALSGSVAAGVGYSSQLGNSHWNAARLDYCRQSFGEDGQPRSFNLQLEVGRHEGPGYGPGLHGPRLHPPGPRPRR